jgi:hypothetical protein
MGLGDDILQEMQRRGSSLPMPSPQDDPPYLAFLKAFAEEVAEFALTLELPGTFHWRPIRPMPNLMGVEMWFDETGGESVHYLVTRAPPLLHHDLVKIEPLGSRDFIIMEADPKVVLAYITF